MGVQYARSLEFNPTAQASGFLLQSNVEHKSIHTLGVYFSRVFLFILFCFKQRKPILIILFLLCSAAGLALTTFSESFTSKKALWEASKMAQGEKALLPSLMT